MSLIRVSCAGESGLVHQCDPCTRELGRVRGVIIFDGSIDTDGIAETIKKAATDAEAAKEICEKIETYVADGLIHIISETTGTFDGGSAQTGDGYGDEDSRLLGYQYTLSFNDPSFGENAEFWEGIEKEHWKIAWRTETLLHFADKPASIQAIDPIEADLTSAVTWSVTATWKSKKKPTLVSYEPISKYFDGCWEVGE